MKILLLSDIHGNFPALEAITEKYPPSSFDLICNCGDSLVYGPYPNQTLDWLQQHDVVSILGNTDRKVRKLLKGKDFKKPRKPEKRIMYTWTVEQLLHRSKQFIIQQKKRCELVAGNYPLFLFHGSPDDPDEFLFSFTPTTRFKEIAAHFPKSIIVTGHSHTPYYKKIDSCHFINPGSVGRMFDSNPAASCAILEVEESAIAVTHCRVDYAIEKTVTALKAANLPSIYAMMFRIGQKLN